MAVSRIPIMDFIDTGKLYINTQPFLKVYKYLKNGYLKIKSDIAPGNGILGFTLIFDYSKTRKKSKFHRFIQLLNSLK